MNRIDEILGFHALDPSHIERIVQIQLDRVKRQLLEQEVTIDFSPEACRRWLSKDSTPPLGRVP